MVAAIISEFNPFHNGHKYLVDKVKSEHADLVIAIMSGNFVQRGDIAITDKFKRAKAALQNGCDLVVELPTVFALSSAEKFAKAGVQIANALGADILCFGAENDDIKNLIAVSDVFDDDKFKAKLKEYLSKGEYYPKAVSMATEELYSKEYSDILSGANNTLAIEYIKALKNTSISPVAIKRNGSDHDSDDVCGNIASATHIRNLIKEQSQYDSFTNMTIDSYTDIQKFETAILYKLRTMTKDEIENLPDVSEGLHNRIFDCVRNSNSLEELYANLKTKRYTLARLRRIVMCAFLGITKELQNSDATYVRVLGVNDKGSRLLSTCKLPLMCKYPQDYNKLSDSAKLVYDIDIKAGELFPLAIVKGDNSYNELKSQIVKI